MTQQPSAELDLELARIEDGYKRRASSNTDHYSYFNEVALFHAQSLERNLLALFNKILNTHTVGIISLD